MAQSNFLERVISQIEGHRIFTRDREQRVVVACSGGPDSSVLLHVLHLLKEMYRFNLIPVHINHLLRKESAAEAHALHKYVKKRYGLETAVYVVPVARLARAGKAGIEETGRLARRRVLEEVAERAGAARIALGHHSDDQAETVIFRMARGAGIRGMCGMKPLAGWYARPLLFLSKEEILSFARSEKIFYVEDRSNRRLDYARNLIRHKVMPGISRINPAAVRHICEFSQTAQELEDYLEDRRSGMADQYFLFGGEGFHVYDPAILGRPGFMRLEAVRAVYEAFTGSLAGIDRRHIEEFAAASKKNMRMNFPRDVVLAKQFNALIVMDKGLKLGGYSLVLREGANNLPSKMGTITAERSGGAGKRFPADIKIRAFMPGDRIGDKKLKELFQEIRLPREFRPLIPLVTRDGRILYSPLFHGNEAIVDGGGKRLKISFKEGELYSKINNLILTRQKAS